MWEQNDIFKTVVENDYDGLVQIVGHNACNSLVSYISMQSRWARQQEDSKTKSEEKVDEFLQHRTYSDSSQRIVSPSCPTAVRQQNDSSYYYILHQLWAFLSGERYECDVIKERNEATDVVPINNTPLMDAYRLIWDASSMLANSRPPANLCIYDKSGSTSPLVNHETDPPIFDGSVALATPASHGGVASGGAGTILHLACAMDRPLMLAFLLIMGADGRSYHTAFRRLMIHEAACNGSINCLTLLLETSHKYLKDTEGKHRSCNGNAMAASITNFIPFLPDTTDLSSFPLSPPQLSSRPLPPTTLNMRHFGRVTGSEKKNNNSIGHADFLSFLQQFRNYGIMVNEGSLSELQAARSMLANVPILESTQAALIRSCSFRNESLHTNHHTFSRQPLGCADGHGNTPLHWASFKDENECVALLLDYNADPNARAHPSGWTPLHDAAYSNSSACIERLCDKGARIDAKASSGATPLCFAAQEDASDAARTLLERGANLSASCSGPPQDSISQSFHFQLPNHPHSRFSGYTPLHYCAHYNAQRASSVLLGHSKAKLAMEVPDLSGRLPIHVAVARGSSDVLRALLHAGARIKVRPNHITPTISRTAITTATAAPMTFGFLPPPVASPAHQQVMPLEEPESPIHSPSSPELTTNSSPVTSPALRSMIPSQPINSSKPWNCLSQQAIDECKELILKSEQSWSPDHHLLFTPRDRMAIMELLRVGKRLEQIDTGIFLDLWPNVLSFCGRGWFESEKCNKLSNSVESNERTPNEKIVTSNYSEGHNFLNLPSFK